MASEVTLVHTWPSAAEPALGSVLPCSKQTCRTEQCSAELKYYKLEGKNNKHQYLPPLVRFACIGVLTPDLMVSTSIKWKQSLFFYFPKIPSYLFQWRMSFGLTKKPFVFLFAWMDKNVQECMTDSRSKINAWHKKCNHSSICPLYNRRISFSITFFAAAAAERIPL